MKKFLVLLFGILLLVPSISLAVGLGGITTYSGLNQPMNAEILILSANSSERNRLTVSLASNAMFEKYGILKDDVLSSLKFGIIEKNSKMYVKVSSVKLISVPYLNFVLQLSNGDDVVSREYAIFLDPIGSRNDANRNTMPAKNNTKSSYENTTKAYTSKQSDSNFLTVEASSGVKYGPIRKGETLWSIAKHSRPSESISVQGMVNTIKKANPKYFSSGRNSLGAGSYIIIPTIKGYTAYAGGYAPMPGMNEASKSKTVKPQSNVIPQNSSSNSAKQISDSDNGAKDQPKKDLELATGSELANNQTDGQVKLNSEDIDRDIPMDDQSSSQQEITDDELAKKQADELAKKQADELAKKQADELAKKQADELAKKQADELAKKQADELAKKQADELAKKQADELAKKQADELAKKQADELAKKQAAVEKSKKTPQSATPNVKKPVVARKAPPPEPTIVDIIFNNIIYIIGGVLGLLLAVLGFILLKKKKKNNSNGKEIVLHDESDIDDLVSDSKSELKTSDVPEFDAAAFDNFDDEFDAPKHNNEIKKTETVSNNSEFDMDSFDDFSDFDIDSDDSTKKDDLYSKQIATAKNTDNISDSPTENKDDFGFDDFDFDFDDDKTKKDALTPEITEYESDKQTLDFDESSFEPHTSDNTTSSNLEDGLSFDFDDFNEKSDDFNNELTISKDSAESISDLDFSNDFGSINNDIFDSSNISLDEKNLDTTNSLNMDPMTTDFNFTESMINNSEQANSDDFNEDLHIPSKEDEKESRIQMKLDLASSFASISDFGRAKEILQDVFEQGTSAQKAKAQDLLAEINKDNK